MDHESGIRPVMQRLPMAKVLSILIVLSLWALVAAVACSDSDNQVAPTATPVSNSPWPGPAETDD